MHLEFGYILHFRQYRTDNKNPKCAKSFPHQFIKIPFYPGLLPKTEAPYQISLALEGTCSKVSWSNPSCCISDFQISPRAEGLRVSEHPDSKGKNKKTRGIGVKDRSATHKTIQSKRATWDTQQQWRGRKAKKSELGLVQEVDQSATGLELKGQPCNFLGHERQLFI